MTTSMDDIIKRHALANAVRYKGKANLGAVLGAVIQETKKSAQELKEPVQKIVEEINKLSEKEQEHQLSKIGAPEKKNRRREGLPELPNVEGSVVMRIAPYPSGPLHIGNTKQLILNDEYVRKYGGKLILFYDDTIGSAEKTITKEAFKLIKEGAEWLGVEIAEEYKKSDRLDVYYDYATQFIEKEKAYVCTCEAELMRENRRNGKACACRSLSLEENKKKWEDMLQYKYKEGTAVLRIKTDIQHKNPAFRDRVLFRISEREHPLVGEKYKVWPLLEFSWAIDDHLLDMTHILRGKDLMMETEMEKAIWDVFGWYHPYVIHTGLLQIENIKLSKSKSKKEVEEGTYSGYDDPRTWSIQSLKKRGIKPEAIRMFVLQGGIGMNDIHVPIDNLYAENQKLIENVHRAFFVARPKKVTIQKAPDLSVEVPVHPDYPDFGTRKFSTKTEFYLDEEDVKLIEEGKLYRLMDCLNFVKKGDVFEFHSTSMDEFRKKKGRIFHWLPVDQARPILVVMPGGEQVSGQVEKQLNAEHDHIFQFERYGFVRCESKDEFYFAHR